METHEISHPGHTEINQEGLGDSVVKQYIALADVAMEPTRLVMECLECCLCGRDGSGDDFRTLRLAPLLGHVLRRVRDTLSRRLFRDEPQGLGLIAVFVTPGLNGLFDLGRFD